MADSTTPRQTALIAIGGGGLTGVAVALAATQDGILGDASVLLALFFAVVTVGLLIHVITERPRTRSRRANKGTAPDRCTTCGGRLHTQKDLRLCRACDTAPAG